MSHPTSAPGNEPLGCSMPPSIQRNTSTSSGQGRTYPELGTARDSLVLQPQDDLYVHGLAVPMSLHLRDQQNVTPHPEEPSFQKLADSNAHTRNAIANPTELPAHEASLKTPERFWFRCYGAFFALFTAGWADGLTGAILPHIKDDFKISYMLSSLLFVTSTFGFALGVIMIEQVMCLLGSLQFRIEVPRSLKSRSIRGTRKRTRATPAFVEEKGKGDKAKSPARARFRVLVIASLFHASFFILMGTATGLSNVLIAYFVASLGKALLNGTVNAYVTTSPKRPLGQLYACNSIGAFVAPLVCQTLLARGIPWSHFYLGSLVLSAINTTLLALAFRPTRNDIIEERNCITNTEAQLQSNCITAGLTEMEDPTIGRSDTAMSEKSSASNSSSFSPSLTAQKDRSCFRFAFKLRHVWAFSFFMCIYSGSETSTQGYIATYLLAVRNANPNTVGYVTSGFWGGMAITRFITGFATPHLSFTQRKHAIHFILGAILATSTVVFALSMHLCIWFIDSVFANAFCTAIVGLLYGPVYPSVLALAVDLLPTDAHMIAMAIIAGFSNLGSSIFPFIAGALSSVRGPQVLVYMTVAQTATLIILWLFFPARSPLHH